MLLIVMYEAQTWRVRPGEPFTFGRAPDCSAVLPADDRGVSRTAGSFRFHDRWWWLHNDSSSCVLCVIGDGGIGIGGWDMETAAKYGTVTEIKLEQPDFSPAN